jgi:hypothetical protein
MLPGEKLFVDFTGMTVFLTASKSGEREAVRFFRRGDG